jgi:hypothetical protein
MGKFHTGFGVGFFLLVRIKLPGENMRSKTEEEVNNARQ